MLMHEPSCVEVNLSAIDHNMAVIRRVVGDGCALCPIVKADAYGLGAARVARRLAAAGASMIAVYSLPQAAEIGRADAPADGGGDHAGLSSQPASIPVLVLMPIADIRPGDETSRMLVSGRLHLTVHDLQQLDALDQLAEQYRTTVPVHVEVDTGMSRGGARPDDALKLLERIAANPRFALKGVFTHFTNSRVDRAATDAQLALFDGLLERAKAWIPEDASIHVASTYALFRHHRYHRSMVRFGLAWAGFGLEELEGCELDLGEHVLRPCLRWRSRVVQVKRIPAGTSVGYGSRWTATRPSMIGLVPIGYADGFPVHRPDPNAAEPAAPQRIAVLRSTHPGHQRGSRTEFPRGFVREFVPVIGTVNMDQITVDLTDVDLLSQPDGGIGMVVEIVSPDPQAPNHLPRLASRSGMIPHEMLCRIHSRIPRVYTVDGALDEHLDDSRSAHVVETTAAAGIDRRAAVG